MLTGFDWQPMGTAPRDGSDIYLRLIGGKVVVAAYNDCSWLRVKNPDWPDWVPDNPPVDPDGIPSIQDCWVTTDDDQIELGGPLQWFPCLVDVIAEQYDE